MPVVTNERAIAASSTLAELVKVRRPMMGAQKMRRVVRALGTQVADYDAQRQELLSLHGDKDADGKRKEENGHVVFADAAAGAAFTTDLAELLLATGENIVALTAKDFGPLTEDGSDWLHEEQAPTPEQMMALGDLLPDAAG
jgi:hypothetical protein